MTTQTGKQTSVEMHTSVQVTKWRKLSTGRSEREWAGNVEVEENRILNGWVYEVTLRVSRLGR